MLHFIILVTKHITMIPSQPSHLSRFQYPRDWVHPRLQCSLRYMVQNVAFNHVVDDRATISSVDRSWRFSCEETLVLSFLEDMRTWWILSNMDRYVSQPTMKGPVVWLPKKCFPLTTTSSQCLLPLSPCILTTKKQRVPICHQIRKMREKKQSFQLDWVFGRHSYLVLFATWRKLTYRTWPLSITYPTTIPTIEKRPSFQAS